ncbi:MAG: hypothetical protein ACNI27_04190 [Desulfovibrio sp.]
MSALTPEDFALTPEEVEEQKREIYEKMAPRRRKFIDRIGYDEWDPFQLPFDPIDLRQEATGLTSHQLTNQFLHEMGADNIGPDYENAIAEFGVMLVMNFEKVRPIYDFCNWYAGYLERKGKTV